MAKQDLTTLSRVRTWLTVEANQTKSDPLLLAEIGRISATTLGWLNARTLLNAPYTEILSGRGGYRIMLRQRPVTSIVSLSYAGTTVPANPQPPGQGSGYTLIPWDGYDPAVGQELILNGYCFPRGAANISLTYNAGYMKTLDPIVIPDASPWQICPDVPGGLFGNDMGVLINGVAGVPVNAAPVAGQYIAAAPLLADPNTGVAANPGYTFAEADAGSSVVITCSYVPLTVENAVCELIAERIRYKDRIGQRSKTLGGQETTSYDPNDFPMWFKNVLQPYRSVVPI